MYTRHDEDDLPETTAAHQRRQFRKLLPALEAFAETAIAVGRAGIESCNRLGESLEQQHADHVARYGIERPARFS